MSYSHVVVWIDHREARVIDFTPDDHRIVTVPHEGMPKKLHRKANPDDGLNGDSPEDPKYYDDMLSYSPYDQLAAKAYPSMFVRTGLWDSQVQYWEPAKYVARLRARRTDRNLLVFRTEMEAGHGGRAGRFQRLHETAEMYAFMLNQLGVPE